MYVPAWTPLNPGILLRRSSPTELLPYPIYKKHNLSFYVARAGIYALCCALRHHGVDAVLVPDYHSGNEVSAIRAAGMRVIFYSINRNLCPDLAELENLTSDGQVGALYVIHFMGWPQPIEDLQRLCTRRGLLLIEDCALAFLSRRGKRPLGTFGDFSVFCLYKTLPIPNGGMLVQNRQTLPELKSLRPRRCSALSLAGRSTELLLSWIRLQSEPVGRILLSMKGVVGRRLSAANIGRTPVGDIGFDLSNVDLSMSGIGRYLMPRFNYNQIVERRRRNYFLLADRLKGVVPFLREDLEEGVCPLFFPILVSDKNALAQRLHAVGIEAVQFWNYGDPEGDKRGGCSQFLRRHVLELPIHQDVSPARIAYIADCVRAMVP